MKGWMGEVGYKLERHERDAKHGSKLKKRGQVKR
jgi:hypothetical protein